MRKMKPKEQYKTQHVNLNIGCVYDITPSVWIAGDFYQRFKIIDKTRHNAIIIKWYRQYPSGKYRYEKTKKLDIWILGSYSLNVYETFKNMVQIEQKK